MSRRVQVLMAAAAAALSAGTSYGQISFDPNAVPGNINGGNGTIGVLDLRPPANPGDQDAARAALLNAANTARASQQYPVINFVGSGGGGHIGNDVQFQQGDGDSIAILARGSINVPTEADYTFIVNSDDGFTLAIDNGARAFTGAFSSYNPAVPAETATALGPYNTITPTYNGNANGALHFYGGRGVNDTGGVVHLTQGVHSLDLTFHEGGGGSAIELLAAPGAKGGYDNTFKLVGSPGTQVHNKLPAVTAFNYTEYNSTNLGDIITSGRTGTPTGVATVRGSNTQSLIHFVDPEGANDGGHPSVAFPFNTGANDENFGAYVTTTMTVTGADVGRYTFVMYTDDDSRFRIVNQTTGVPLPLVGTTTGDQFDSDGANGNDQFGTNGCCLDQIGHYDLTAGTYTIEAAFHEGGGGSGFFLYGTQGDASAFDPAAFQLIGAGTDGGLVTTGQSQLQFVAVPEPTTVSLLGLAGLGIMARRRKA